MTEIHLNLNNFLDFEQLLRIFPFSNKYEFTSNKVFRLKNRITCKCSNLMTHNGYNYARKNGFGKVKIGKQRCPSCDAEYHEDKAFWKNLLSEWKETVTSLLLVLRDSSVSWQVISKIMNYIIPCSKDKVRYLFKIWLRNL